MITEGTVLDEIKETRCIDFGGDVAAMVIGDGKEAELLAALIAAAPETKKQRDDLLAACKGLLKAFDIPLIAKHNDPGLTRLRSTQQAEQAIAAAEKGV
jgi:hypothetical protein